MLNKLKSILPEKSNWEKDFDKLVENNLHTLGDKCLECMPASVIKDIDKLKQFIQLLLDKQRESTEALLPDMLALIREEIMREMPKYPPNSDREELVIKNIKELIIAKL